MFWEEISGEAFDYYATQKQTKALDDVELQDVIDLLDQRVA